MDVLLINGPNLNLLGTRAPEVYGGTTLHEVEEDFRARAQELGLTTDCLHSNHEGAIVDRIHACLGDGTRFIVINAGAYTHTSVAIRDALEAVRVPFVEIHISNIHAREDFRQHSLLSMTAAGVIVGCGVYGYRMALDYCAHRLASA